MDVLLPSSIAPPPENPMSLRSQSSLLVFLKSTSKEAKLSDSASRTSRVAGKVFYQRAELVIEWLNFVANFIQEEWSSEGDT